MKPWLLLPPQLAHDLGPWALPIISTFCKVKNPQWNERRWRDLTFRNPVGLAGGADKTGHSLIAWQKLGVGFLEVGTVTPLPQNSNPGKILDRDISRKAVWNKMGFPNSGAVALEKKIKTLKPQLQVPLFVNIGKNRNTANSLAAQDYVTCLQTLWTQADAFVVNISSPNTKDLRELLQPENLQRFLQPIIVARNNLGKQKPLLLKLSPDMDSDSLQNALQTSLDMDIDGWILTNTTVSRPSGISFPTEGGLSGAPLRDLSLNCLNNALTFLKQRKEDRLVISTGGIGSTEDVRQRLEAGADLVQIYSALVFEGPLLFGRILKDLQSAHL